MSSAQLCGAELIEHIVIVIVAGRNEIGLLPLARLGVLAKRCIRRKVHHSQQASHRRGWPEGTVATRLATARRILAKRLRGSMAIPVVTLSPLLVASTVRSGPVAISANVAASTGVVPTNVESSGPQDRASFPVKNPPQREQLERAPEPQDGLILRIFSFKKASAVLVANLVRNFYNQRYQNESAVEKHIRIIHFDDGNSLGVVAAPSDLEAIRGLIEVIDTGVANGQVGPFKAVGQVLIVGNEKTAADLILKAVQLSPDQILTDADLRKSEDDGQNLNRNRHSGRLALLPGSRGEGTFQCKVHYRTEKSARLSRVNKLGELFVALTRQERERPFLGRPSPHEVSQSLTV